MKKIIFSLSVILGLYSINGASYEVSPPNLTNSSGNLTDIVEYVLLGEGNPCARKCQKNAMPMTCRYHFALEWYHTLSKACYDCPFNSDDCYRPDCIPGDGHRRPVTVVNRKMPGPTIEVCLGDEVTIDVENRLASDSTTIHWHGHHQRDNPYMDGVPFVTQCPIHSGSIFRYHFQVKNSGTHFWHSHSGFQRADGAFGAFIVKVPEDDDPHSNLYDYDLPQHVVTILDWGKELGVDKFVAHHHNNGDNKPSTLLVNGLGRFKKFVVRNSESGQEMLEETESENSTVIYTPVAQFLVEQGYRYRFRVINAGFLNCPIEISVDNHTLIAISSDGMDFAPEIVESIVTYAGERFDFILNADQPKDSYWMRFSGLMDCDQRFKRAHQVAILRYKNSDNVEHLDEPTYDTSKKRGRQLNSLNKGTEKHEGDLHVTMPHLKSLDPWDDSLKEHADFQYYVSYDFYKIDNPHFHKFPYYGFKNVTDKKKQLLTPQLNHISMKFQSFPLLSQRYQLEDDMVCNETTVKGCETDYCECTHVVNIPLNSIVEMVLIDQGFAFDANHPFHLHGHSFRVVAMEKIGKNVTVAEVLRRDKMGLIKRNLKDAPIKDTVTVPDGGYTIIRFNASNPGYWLFHCHIEFHVEVGMALILKIGRDHQMPPIPTNFPKCGNYFPEPLQNQCKEASGFVEIVKKILPNVYKDYCDSNHSTSASRSFMRHSKLFILLISFVIVVFTNHLT